MLDAVVWGLVQGLTEFLPISSSGHLVLVPAFLGEMGTGIEEPELAVSAVLHLGTLIAVLAYYRRDLVRLTRWRTEPGARTVLWMLALGTVPALIGLPLEGALDTFEDDPVRVSAALAVTGVVLLAASRIRIGTRRLEDGRWQDAALVGVAQAAALVPGISRSGMTIGMGLGRGFSPVEAARYSFLLAVPAIAGGGLISLLRLDGSDTDLGALAVGLIVAAVSGYAAITWLLRLLVRVGFLPFALYCLTVGGLGIVIL